MTRIEIINGSNIYLSCQLAILTSVIAGRPAGMKEGIQARRSMRKLFRRAHAK